MHTLVDTGIKWVPTAIRTARWFAEWEDVHNSPKALASFRGQDGAAILLACGRSGYVSAYRTENGIPQKSPHGLSAATQIRGVDY